MPSIVTNDSITVIASNAKPERILFSDITNIKMVRDPNSADWIGKIFRGQDYWLACSIGSYFHVKDTCERLVERIKKAGRDVKLEEEAAAQA
jgi:hypothetical protein